MGDIHQRHGVVAQHGNAVARLQFGQRLPRQHGGQGAFEAAKVQIVVPVIVHNGDV